MKEYVVFGKNASPTNIAFMDRFYSLRDAKAELKRLGGGKIFIKENDELIPVKLWWLW